MKSLFTTGEAAQICNISQQTIIRCFDSGRLDGFRIPGSRFRRIPRENLIKFMKDNGIPLDNFNTEKNGKIKVLIVDDDVEIVELMVDVLSRDGRFDLQTAGSGYEAGLKTEQFRPDVIILDYMLPDVNGNIVCRTIKSNPDFESIRIIIVSGVANPEEVQDLLDAGATEFIKKPFNIADLVGRILQVVDKEYVAAVH
ncbi:MAG: response regulator [Planctomycetes bacterium]|nr:response regulator [Planctomycetota bacterium]